MNNRKLYLRFGVHKDRQVMHDCGDLFDGLVVPAHILSYSSDATKMAIRYIQKPFFIDPMTHILSKADIESYVTLNKKTSKKCFKPSIQKLVESYKLETLFSDREYSPLQPSDFNDAFVEEFVSNVINLQVDKVNERGGVVQKYLEILVKAGYADAQNLLEASVEPAFIACPYFFFSSLEDDWLDVNLRIAKEVKRVAEGHEVVPILFTNTATLNSGLLDKYSDFNKFIIWVEDLNEKSSIDTPSVFVTKLSALKQFVELTNSRGKELFNLYGSFYSVIMTKLGLSGLSHGIFYGEYKSGNASIGGVPPSRYYLRKLHQFFTLHETTLLLNKEGYKDLLDGDSKAIMEIIDSKVENIFSFDKNPSLAQKHFLMSRKLEFEDIESKTIEDLSNELDSTYSKYNPLPDDITKKNINYIDAWAKALK